MLAALSASTAPVTAVLAGLWEDDLCKGSKPNLQQAAALPAIMQPQCQPVSSTLQPSAQLQLAPQSAMPEQSGKQQQQQAPQQASQPLQQHHLSSSVSVARPLQQSEPREHRQRRPSRSAPVSPVRGAAASPPASNRAGYSTDAYWDNRYAEKSTHFDWFYNYSALASLINKACDKRGPCLHVGCGNSGLSTGMVKDGFQVVNVDISAVVIEQMRRMHGVAGQSWEVADCRSMPQYADGSFGSVLDKGTLDAVLCSSHGQADTIDYVTEVHRLLMPGGVFLLISLGQPHARFAALNALANAPATSIAGLQYLSDKYQQLHLAVAAAAAGAASKGGAGYGWSWESVQVYLLPKPSLYLAGELSLTGRGTSTSGTRHAPHTDKDMPVEWLGPYTAGPELDKAIAEASVDLREYFTAFVCKKKPSSRDAKPASSPAAYGRSSGSSSSSRHSGSRSSQREATTAEPGGVAAEGAVAAAPEGG